MDGYLHNFIFFSVRVTKRNLILSKKKSRKKPATYLTQKLLYIFDYFIESVIAFDIIFAYTEINI